MACNDGERYVQQEKPDFVAVVEKSCPRVLLFDRTQVAFGAVQSLEANQRGRQLDLLAWHQGSPGAHAASLLLPELLSMLISRTRVMEDT